MEMRHCLVFAIILASLGVSRIHAQYFHTTEYITLKEGRLYLVSGGEGTYLDEALAVTDQLTVNTNGLIEIAGGGEEILTENKRLTLDGFWITADGTLQAFQPHYLMKGGVLYLVKSGVATRLERDVVFPNGNVLRLDGILVSGIRLIRLQDGQRFGLKGEVIPALDHIMMANGRLVLQKDGMLVPLPLVSMMGMSEGSRVTGGGLITTPSGQQFVLGDGQRVTLEGAAMLMPP